MAGVAQLEVQKEKAARDAASAEHEKQRVFANALEEQARLTTPASQQRAHRQLTVNRPLQRRMGDELAQVTTELAQVRNARDTWCGAPRQTCPSARGWLTLWLGQR